MMNHVHKPAKPHLKGDIVDLFGKKKKLQRLEEERRKLDMQRSQIMKRENVRVCKKCQFALPDDRKVCPKCGEIN